MGLDVEAWKEARAERRIARAESKRARQEIYRNQAENIKQLDRRENLKFRPLRVLRAGVIIYVGTVGFFAFSRYYSNPEMVKKDFERLKNEFNSSGPKSS